MLSYRDVLGYRERCEDLVREAANDRLARQALAVRTGAQRAKGPANGLSRLAQALAAALVALSAMLRSS
jgi:hypothetical protein